MSNKDLSNHLIEQYRSLVSKRYRYPLLKQEFGLPPTIGKGKVNAVREYFLMHIYPDSETREILNAAFDHLESHFKNPGHLIQLVGDASGVLFKFGFQFPKALRAGMNALSSFKAATEFEKGLLQAAEAQQLTPPLSETQFLQLIAALPESKVRKFIANLDDLLSALTDVELMGKTVEILTELIAQMRKHPEVYSKIDVLGMEIGWNILNAGHKLFQQLPSSERRAMIELIIKAENHFIKEIYRNNSTAE